MDDNLETLKNKSKKSFKSCPSAILKAVPDIYKKITFSQLSFCENYDDKAIIGKICHLNPLGIRPNGYIRKILVTDGLEEQKIEQKKLTVFLLDQFAQDSEKSAEIEGYIIIANFLLEKSTHHKENEFPFQILVRKPETKIWFGKKVTPSLSNNQVKKKKRRKKEECESNIEPIILSNHYEYVHLRDLQETGDKETFNIYGIVEKCDLKVTQGKRTQVLDLVLTDNTDTGFSCSVYCAKDERFPDIYPGDIVRIHRLKVEKFRSKLKGKCLSSKFILVFHKNEERLKPKTVAKSFTLTEEDTIKVKNLFEWYDQKNQPKLISEIKRGDFANILCQVIGVYIAKKTNAVILKIWDGTKTNQIESSHWGLRDEKLDEKLFQIAKQYYVVLNVYGQHCASAGELKPGQYIEVKDAHLYSPKENPDECKLCLHAGNKEKRGIQVLNLDDTRLTELKERLEEIVTDVQELANQTDDILNGDNSIFLNCDFSTISSQKSSRNEDVAANIDVLNKPLPPEDKEVQEQNVISVIEAAIKPGQSTQEFGEEMQKEYMEVDINEENELTQVDSYPVLNKTPVEYRMLLHNPVKEDNVDSIPPFNHDSPDEWWTSLPATSVLETYSDAKPSSLAEVIQHEVPHKFRVLCIVLSYKPNSTSIVDLILLHCPSCMFMSDISEPTIEPFLEQDGLFYYYCPECSKTDSETKPPILRYSYVISLELHDGTTMLEAYLWDENAVKLLKGITPEEALRNKEKAEAVMQMLWNICPNNRPLQSATSLVNGKYPNLDCCIVSYEAMNQTVYQICDTKLI